MALTQVIPAGMVTLRSLHRRDGREWMALRGANAAWLNPWEATAPNPLRPAGGFPEYVKAMTKQAKAGSAIPLVIELGGRIAGQVNVTGISGGSQLGGSVGYWIGREFAGLGIMPTAVAMVTDYCFDVRDLHRIEVNIRPGNERSLRVVGKLGFRDEGLRARYLHISQGWRDHRTFALTQGEIPEGVLARYLGSDQAPTRDQAP
ncbi:MAG: GNAT family N-acetyltransferase [Cellulomonadaceae bacterium]|jgi:ribosomal-protein-alanine N-acetyltransferase|nr:GNAT family N-acetyltransferase [Cellulomonadaceae bacterium]